MSINMSRKVCEGCGHLFSLNYRCGQKYWKLRKFCNYDCFRKNAKAVGFYLKKPRKKNGPQKIWTDDDINILKNIYPNSGAQKTARQLNRTVNAVKTRASMLGLKIYCKDKDGIEQRMTQMKIKKLRLYGNLD